MRRLALLPLLAALFILAACSGGASPVPAAATPASTPAGGASAPASAGGASAPASAAGGAAICATAPAGSTAAVTVTIKDFKFSPQPIQAKVGDVIAWSNQDGSTPHSAAMDTAGCKTDTINGGSTAMLVFNVAGTYTYHCAIHPTQMKDYTIVVS
jgi:plastocyanin